MYLYIKRFRYWQNLFRNRSDRSFIRTRRTTLEFVGTRFLDIRQFTSAHKRRCWKIVGSRRKNLLQTSWKTFRIGRPTTRFPGKRRVGTATGSPGRRPHAESGPDRKETVRRKSRTTRAFTGAHGRENDQTICFSLRARTKRRVRPSSHDYTRAYVTSLTRRIKNNNFSPLGRCGLHNFIRC